MKYPYGLAADLHFHPWSAFASTSPSGMNTRLELLLNELERLAKETHDAGGDTVVLAGDIFHVRGSVSPTVLNAVRDSLMFLVAQYKVSFYILAGNHDLEGKNSTRLGSAVTALEMTNVHIVNEPTKLNDLILIPWYDSVEDLKAEIKKWADRDDTEDLDLILHAPIDGVIPGLPPHGLTGEWLAGVSANGFRRVFSGHYHNHKLVYDGAEPSLSYGTSVYSIGALAHHTWSDVGTRAGFLIVGKHSVNWRKSHLPAFVDLDKLTEVDPDELPFMVDKNYVRVKVESASAKEVAEFRDELAKMNAMGVLIQAIPTPPKRDDGVVAAVGASVTLEASIGAFVKSLGDAKLASDALHEALAVLIEADTETA